MITPSDSERVAVAKKLRDAVAMGLLPFDELEKRLDAAYAADSVEDLERLVRFLPAERSTRRPRRRAVIAVASSAMVVASAGAVWWGTHRAEPTAGTDTALTPTEAPVLAETPQPTNAPDVAQVASTSDSAYPVNGVVAIVSVDRTKGRVTVVSELRDVTYDACDGYGVDGLRVGAFGTLDVDGSKPCARGFRPAARPSCGGDGYGGYANVLWHGYNADAQSVLYSPEGSSEIIAVRWCRTPTIKDTDGSVIRFDQVRVGAKVQLVNSHDDWLKSIEVLA